MLIACLSRLRHTSRIYQSFRYFLLPNCATMDKNRLYNSDFSLRHVRYREQVGNNITPPSSIELVVVGSGIGGAPKSLIVNCSNTKYLFNCGEATQRIIVENKLKLSRVDHIFVTQSSWENVGGLLGLCLTMESTGLPKVVLHGPPCAEFVVTAAEGFSQLRFLKLEKRELSEGEFIDSALQITSVPLYSAQDSSHEAAVSGNFENTDIESLKKKLRLSVSPRERNMAVAYVCKPFPKLRALSLEKCVDFEVPVGPLMGKLKSGRAITLANGRVVLPEDVLEKTEPNSAFVVVECPSAEYLDSLVENTTLANYQSDSDEDCKILVVVHFTPSHIMRLQAYQEWMAKFGPDTQHLMLNDHASELALQSVYTLQAKLNLLHPGIFPLLPHQLVDGSSLKQGVDENNIIYGEPNLRYVLRGHNCLKFDRDLCTVVDNVSAVSAAMENNGFEQALENVRQQLALQNTDDTDEGQYPEILFLGTGSAVPSKVRNVSAIWINVSEEVSVLLDCGENTYGQLYRHYGREKTAEMISRLRAVFVSHLHADHHMGLPGIVLERQKVLSKKGETNIEPLTVVTSGPLDTFYCALNSRLIPLASLIRIVPLKYCYKLKRTTFDVQYNELLQKLGLKTIDAVRVNHRQYPHAFILEHPNGWKLAYSGDTTPCQDFIDAVRGCSVLIHEATMEDDLEDDAKNKRHSTTSQAIDVGIKMNAEFILLTHFSQRYAKVPIFNENFSSRVGIAFDNMRVRRCDLKLLPLLTPALKLMFTDAYTEMQVRTDQRKRRKLMVKLNEPKTSDQPNKLLHSLQNK